MTAIVDGVMVMGTPEEISQLIKIHNTKIVHSTSSNWQLNGGQDE